MSRELLSSAVDRDSSFWDCREMNFQLFPSVKFEESWRIKSGDLQTLISHTSFAVSTEESRPILNGVLWEIAA